MSLPNLLTLFRLFIIPILVVSFYWVSPQHRIWVSFIFLFAALTDALDGWIARNLNITSKFGAFLDPVADKLLVAVTLILLVSKLDYLVIPAMIIVSREIIVSALREWMAELGKRASLAVSWLGKIKTAMQMVALLLLLAVNPQVLFQNTWITVIALMGYTALYAATFLTIWSMVAYLRVAWDDLVRN